MFSIERYRPQSHKDLRSFGLILAAGFFVIGTLSVVRHPRPGRVALGLSIAFMITGLLVPNLLRYIHRVWMLLGNAVGWINTNLILTIFFYMVVTPVGSLMSLVGTDPMNRKFDPKAETYRVTRKPRDASHMKYQF